MRLLYRGVQYAGPAIELVGADPDALAARVREGHGIDCPTPTPAHGYVGCITPETSLPLRAALAAAARTRGYAAPEDDEIAAMREEIEGIDTETVDLRALRERVAETGIAETELRERVARLGGEVEARRDIGTDVEEAETELRAAATELSEAETEHLAARQALRSARERAREQRNEREHERRLADRADNLRRRARRTLAADVYGEFAAALESVPTTDAVRAGTEPSEYAGDDVSAALAVARLADLRAPVVVACGRFRSAREARRALDCQVIRVQNSA